MGRTVAAFFRENVYCCPLLLVCVIPEAAATVAVVDWVGGIGEE